jgi:lysozyme
VTLALGATVLVSGFGLTRGWWRVNHPDPSEFPVWGVDVSHHQGAVDWRRVAQVPHIRFAYVKATEGGDWVDPRLESNWKAARAAGFRGR